MSIAIEKFLTIYQQRVGELKPAPADALRQLLGFVNQDTEVRDLRQRAYMLATVRHETADTFAPLHEVGTRRYFNQYEPGTPKGKALGNLERGDGFLFRGRGYVQITGRANYARLSHPEYANRNLIARPDDALLPSVAYRILSKGMAFGLFTGKALDRYIDQDRADYFSARRVINGLDKALLISEYAKVMEEALQSAS